MVKRMMRTRKRLWHLKQERRRAKRFKIERANLEIRSNAVNCLTDCPDPGACCRLIVLWNGYGDPCPQTESMEEAQKTLDEHFDLYPFEIYAFGRTPNGKPIWYLRCKMVTTDGRCGIYEYRPELCRCFKPCIDRPCLLTKGGAESFARYHACMTRVICEEGTLPEKGGDAE